MDISFDTASRFERAFSKTTSIANKIKFEALHKAGKVLSNNRNQINRPKSEPIRGA